MGAKEGLLFGRECFLQGREKDRKKEEAEASAEDGKGNQHGVKSYMSYMCYIVTSARRVWVSSLPGLRFECGCGVSGGEKGWILLRFVRMGERSGQRISAWRS